MFRWPGWGKFEDDEFGEKYFEFCSKSQVPGEPGLDGVPGRAGADGIPGKDGIPGTDGKNGLNGKDGQSQ